MKRRRSWGTIKSVTREKHILRWTQHIPGEVSRGTETFYGTYREASARLDSIHVEVMEAERDVKELSPTIGWIYENWYLPDMRRKLDNGRIKQNTYDNYLNVWDIRLKEQWNDIAIDDVSPFETQKWIDSLTKSTAQIALIILRAIGDIAIKYRAATENRFRIKYELPANVERTKNNERVFSLQESIDALKALEGTYLEGQYIVNAFGGARPGESLGVKVDEIGSLETCGLLFATVPIVRMMPFSGKLPYEDHNLKNRHTERIAIVPPPYSHQLLEIADNREVWLSDRGDGYPMDVAHYKYELRMALGADSPTPTGLRKSWRTYAQFDWKVDYHTLEHLMGHKVKGVTEQFYLRPTIEQLAQKFAEAYVKLG